MRLLQESPVEFLEPLSKPPESIYVTEVKGPYGSVVIGGSDKGVMLARLCVSIGQFSRDIHEEWGTHSIIDDVPLKRTIEGFKAYFEGVPGSIEATVQPLMTTPFILKVHQYLTRIPYGQTLTYGDIAASIGNPRASRAVGGACGRNRVLIIVPCHRVVARNGIGGFGRGNFVAGLKLKRSLIEHEGIKW